MVPMRRVLLFGVDLKLPPSVVQGLEFRAQGSGAFPAFGQGLFFPGFRRSDSKVLDSRFYHLGPGISEGRMGQDKEQLKGLRKEAGLIASLQDSTAINYYYFVKQHAHTHTHLDIHCMQYFSLTTGLFSLLVQEGLWCGPGLWKFN